MKQQANLNRGLIPRCTVRCPPRRRSTLAVLLLLIPLSFAWAQMVSVDFSDRLPCPGACLAQFGPSRYVPQGLAFSAPFYAVYVGIFDNDLAVSTDPFYTDQYPSASKGMGFAFCRTNSTWERILYGLTDEVSFDVYMPVTGFAQRAKVSVYGLANFPYSIGPLLETFFTPAVAGTNFARVVLHHPVADIGYVSVVPENPSARFCNIAIDNIEFQRPELRPDLRVVQLALQPYAYPPQLSFEFSNVGGDLTVSTTADFFWISGDSLNPTYTQFHSINIPAGLLGSAGPMSLNLGPFWANRPDNLHGLELRLDATNRVDELNETNNLLAVALPINSVTLTAHRVSLEQAAVRDGDPLDAPIEPVTDPARLASAPPLGLGVVADGVTPVLFSVLATPGIYTVSIDGGLYRGNLNDRLFVLQPGGGWARITVLTVDSQGKGFFYLQGADWTESPVKEAECTIALQPSGGDPRPTTLSFKLRPPPVVLVHGYASSEAAWGPAFRAELDAARPESFVKAIDYGVSYRTVSDRIDPLSPPELRTITDTTVNTGGRLDELAKILEEQLSKANLGFDADWAYTRHDVVGHSQGGVLARMLCTGPNSYNFGKEPFAGEANMFRGRFRRVITIGSPHNGSLLLYYMLALKEASPTQWRKYIPYALGSYIQEKFDPFGPQIRQINNRRTEIHPEARFCLIRCTINYGFAPGDSCVPAFNILGLCSKVENTTLYRGGILLPRGTDGIVDFDSMGAGIRTLNTGIVSDILGHNITHADVAPLLRPFGVSAGQSETTHQEVALEVVRLLDGPKDRFGAFPLPPRLSDALKVSIDSIVPRGLEFLDVIESVLSKQNLSFTLSAPPSRAIVGDISWHAEVFTTNGVSTDGILLTDDLSAPNTIIVSVDDGVVGDVVLYAIYPSTGETLVVAEPRVVLSRPIGENLGAIELTPPKVTASVGDEVSTAIWGNFTDGARGQLYVRPGDAAFHSSAPDIASVDSAGNVKVNSYGEAVITAIYGNLSAQMKILPVAPEIRNLTLSLNTNGIPQLSYSGTYGVTNIIQSSSNLVDWTTLSRFRNTEVFVEFPDHGPRDAMARFYRVLAE